MPCLSSPAPSNSYLPGATVLIFTTIYFTELEDLRNDKSQQPFALEPSAARTHDLFRELLSLYEGRNRVLPIDRKD